MRINKLEIVTPLPMHLVEFNIAVFRDKPLHFGKVADSSTNLLQSVIFSCLSTKILAEAFPDEFADLIL